MPKSLAYGGVTVVKAAKRRAFTLVELIVVLAVLAILAAAGVGTAVGYVKRSKFNQNQENAVTVYQITQTALSQMEKNGSLDDWVRDQLLVKGDMSPYVSSNPSNNPDVEQRFETSRASFDGESAVKGKTVHIRYSLTYIPGSDDDQSVLLSDLIRPYFYEASIFQSTITVEFDVVNAYDSDLISHYSANCYSAFVSAEYKEGWGEGTKIPARDFEERSKKTFIGYFDDGGGTLTDIIYVPLTENLSVSYKELFYNRLNRVLNISWSVNSGNNCILGRGKHIHYAISLMDAPDPNDSEAQPVVFCEMVILEDRLLEGQTSGEDLMESLAKASEGSLVSAGGRSYVASVQTLQRQIVNGTDVETHDYQETSFIANAHVYVASGDNMGQFDSKASDESFYVDLPVKIAYITGDIDSMGGLLAPYMTYTIMLDQESCYKVFDPAVHTNVSAAFQALPNRFDPSQTLDSAGDNVIASEYDDGIYNSFVMVTGLIKQTTGDNSGGEG